MSDGSLSGPERSETLKGTRNVFGFGKTVSILNTSVSADTVGASQCIRSMISESSPFAERGLKKSYGDKAWMLCKMETVDRTDVAEGERRNGAARRIEVSENCGCSAIPN